MATGEHQPPTAEDQRRDEIERLIADLALRVILDREEDDGRQRRDPQRN